MVIVITLEEMLNKCSDWEQFCDDKGWDYYVVNEGGGDLEVSLTIDEAKKYELL